MSAFSEFNISANSFIEGNLLWGKKLAQQVRNHIKNVCMKEKLKPGLAVLLAGNDPASQIYVGGKEKAAAEAGFFSEVKTLPENCTQEELLAVIHEWNMNPAIHGILVQLPLPRHINEQNIIQSILSRKDADGFHFENQGKLLCNVPGTVACTPLGIAMMLYFSGVDITGKHAVILGRSNIVGKPMAQLLLNIFNCTVTTCHSRTREINRYAEQADILISAMGVRDVISSSSVRKGAIVIDVGMHRSNGKLTGDLDFDAICHKASLITPVPGGVGPMTIAMLLYNTLQNALKYKKDTEILSGES